MPVLGELDRYSDQDFVISHTEKEYGDQVLRPFVEEVRKVGKTGQILDLASGSGVKYPLIPTSF